MLNKLFFLFIFGFTALSASSQCFQVFDGNGVASNNPYFISCTPGSFTVFIQVDQNIGPYVISWGDGSPNNTGAVLTTAGNVSHIYAATTDTFNITITDQSTGCVVNGVVVLERNPLASIQLPAGDDNFGCTPVQFRFINSSTQISETTVFQWDFGDGTPVQVFDHTNAGDTVLHTYLPGIGAQSCNLEVRLTATNYCGTSTASFFPLRVWDLDEANINASATLLCYPDTIVQYTNATVRNCFADGNTSQRYEKWNFGDYWGLGYDSIIDWRPWNPPITPPPPMAYPGVGTYTVTLIDSSFCGLDTTTLAITITNPPTAILSSNRDTICEGETVRFFNNSIGGANQYSWNFDRGQGWQNLNGNTKNRIFTAAGNYTIRLAVGIAGAQGCSDTASIDLYVNPSPVADFSFDTNNGCDSMQVNFSDLSTGSPVSWIWDFGNGNTYVGQNPPTQSYTAAGVYAVKLVITNAQGCLDSLTRNIRVREVPQAAFSVNNVCLNQLASFSDQSIANIDPITSYKWYFGDGDSSTIANPNHLYTAFGTYNVIQIVDNGFCIDTAQLSVTVSPNPTAAFSADTLQGCSRLTVNFTNQSSPNAVRFIWDFGDGSPADTLPNPSHVFSNTSSADTTFIVQLIALSQFGCADTISDTVRVFPIPTPAFTSNAVLDCGPLQVDFTNLTQGNGLSYFWDFGDGSPIVNDTNPSHIFQNQTLFISIYNVQLVVVSSNGCSDTTQQQLTVYPEPRFSFSAVPDSGCSPLRVRFPSVVGAVSYQWDFGDGNTASGPTPTHVFVNNTTNNRNYTVRLIAQNSFGCLDTSTANILVYPNPTASFSLDTNLGCQPLVVNVTNNSTGATSYSWDFGDATVSDTAAANFQKTYTNTSLTASFNDLQLIVESADGCRDTLERQVRVHPFIQAAFTSDTVGCSPLRVSFNNQSIGAANYNWSFGDGNSSGAIGPTYTYVNATNSNQTFNAQLIATSAELCADTVNQNILVYPKPTAAFSITDSIGCHPLSVSYTNNSSLADSCWWNFGDGSQRFNCNASFVDTFTNTTSFFPVDYINRLIVFTDEGCKDTLQKTIRVNPQIIADFASDTAGCSPLNIRFQDQSTAASSFQWTFGDGAASPARNPSHFFINLGLNDTTFTTQLKVQSNYGCEDSIQQRITVYPKPIADFSLDVNDGCHPLPVQFTNNSAISDSCIWNFGDGNSLSDCSPTVNHVYNNALSIVPLNYNAQLIVITDRSCSDTLSRQIRVKPDVQADFSVDTIGCSPLDLTFRSQSFGAISYRWDFGDGDFGVGQISSHQYTNTGSVDSIYTARLIAESLYQCNDTAFQDITVYPTPIPDFTPSPIFQVFPNSTVNITNTTNPGNWTYFWDFRDSSTSNVRNPASHTYNRWGKYLIKLVASSANCADSVEKLVEIDVPVPIADFGDSAVGCEPLTVQFDNQSVYGNNYYWEFGDGGTSTAENPAYTYLRDGTYTVSLKVTGFLPNKKDSIIKQNLVQVYPSPIAQFSANKQVVYIPQDPLVLSNTSIDATNYFWDFGDSTTSNEKSPVHYYQEEGLFDIFLVASNSIGCSDTFYLPIPIKAELESRIAVPNAFTPNPNGGNGGRINPFASGANLNDVFYAKIQGSTKYELNIFNKWGELLFVSQDVNIGWDGYYKGEICQQDVYVWKIKAEFADGESIVKAGDLMLLR